MTINVVCRRDAINRNRLAPLALVFTHDRRRKFVGLGISEALVHWDFDKQQPTADCPDRAEIQFQITSKIREYEKKIKKLEVLEIPVTFDTLFEQNGKRINCTVGEYFKQIIERLEKVEKYSSASKHKVTLVLVSQFRSVNMRFDELDLTYLREFEIFLSQKGNVNNSCNYAAFQYCRLYLIEILHQTTTVRLRVWHASRLYLIEILHQTTTQPARPVLACTLYLIEILHQTTTITTTAPSRGVLYLIEILHQTTTETMAILKSAALYLIEILHQTTTNNATASRTTALYLIEILHQTTTVVAAMSFVESCILSKFYIKPQLAGCLFLHCKVVSYRNSTSNHNYRRVISVRTSVVSYRNSTSNHNSRCPGIGVETVVSYRNSTSNHNGVNATMSGGSVVSYRNSTSNHNCLHRRHWRPQLYLIEILHQTTTSRAAN